jgi:hypothetical protein
MRVAMNLMGLFSLATVGADIVHGDGRGRVVSDSERVY